VIPRRDADVAKGPKYESQFPVLSLTSPDSEGLFGFPVDFKEATFTGNASFSGATFT
jgi:hypothetical protein